MTVIPFPAVEPARELERVRAKFGDIDAELGDFVAVCMVEAPREAWVLFPIASVTKDGLVDRVITEHGGSVPIDLIKLQFPSVILRAATVRDLDQVRAQCWRVWPTFQALKDTLRPLARRAANDEGSPQDG